MRAFAVLTLLACACAAAAHAADDRASEVLASEPLFMPKQPGVSRRAADELRDTLAKVDVRIALIPSRKALGPGRRFFRRPREYARFLGRRLRFVYGGRLLVVMPNGLAVSRRGRVLGPDTRRLRSIRIPKGRDGLALAATAAAERLAGATRAPRSRAVNATTFASTWRLSQRTAVAIAVAAVAAILLPGALVARSRRRRLRRYYYGW
jgi:hypothetical protein